MRVAILMFVADRHVTPRRPRFPQRPHESARDAPSQPPAHAGRVWHHRLRALASAAVIVAGLGGCGAQASPPGPSLPALAATVVPGPRGEVEDVHLAGSSFGAHGDYTIYLPPGYGLDPERRYPVVYLLHGGSDTVSFFLELGIQEAMEEALGSGTVGPMLLVLVDGGPKFDGDGHATRSFDDYLAAELIPDVDHRWRTRAERTGRAVGGVSLGGRHALEFAAAHPSLVGAVGGHSTTVPRSPEALAQAKIPIYLDVGESDGLYDDDAALARQLRRLGAHVLWHPAPGQHGRPYWSAHLPDYLRFYSDALGARGG
jgi:enterochelin esterase-like enzyme